MPKQKAMENLKNIEFFVDLSSETPVRAIQDGKYISFSDIPDNLINILYARFLDYAAEMRCCISANDSKRDVVEKMIIKLFGKLDNELDIDDQEQFHFDPADLAELRRSCSINLQLQLSAKKEEAFILDHSIRRIEKSINNLNSIRL